MVFFAKNQRWQLDLANQEFAQFYLANLVFYQLLKRYIK
jgi:hypothetical protein